MSTKAQERALSIVELLDSILCLLETSDLASCARVCHLWEMPSLRILWKQTATHFGALLKILGPLEPSDGPIVSYVHRLSWGRFSSYQRFESAPELVNWARFHRYSSLVRISHLIIQEGDTSVALGSSLAPRTIHQLRSLAEAKQVPLFPNLLGLGLGPLDRESCGACVFLITDTLQSLSLAWHQCDWISLLPHLRQACRCTSLATLKIYVRPNGPLDEIAPLAAEVAQLLVLLTKLEVVTLPSSVALYPDVWHAMQHLPYLRNINSLDRMAQDPKATPDHLELGHGFRRLESLQCTTTFREAMRLLAPVHPNPVITTLALHVRGATDSPVALLSAIPKAVPQVKEVTVNFYHHDVPLRLDDISPLTQLSGLTQLHVGNRVVAGLSDNDYGVLVKCLSRLETLSISPEPSTISQPPATLLALSNIAAHCQHIRMIKILVDASANALPSHDTPLTPFASSLRVLAFGPPVVGDPMEVAFRLSRMFLWCKPEIITTEPPEGINEETSTQYDAAEESWDTVMYVLAGMWPTLDAFKRTVHDDYVAMRKRCAELTRASQLLDERVVALEASAARLSGEAGQT